MVKGGLGGNVDDGAAVLLEQRGNRSPGECKTGVHIQVEHQLPGLALSLPECLASAVAADGVYQEIQPSVTRGDGTDQVVAGSFVGRIQSSNFQASGRAYGGLQRLGFVLLYIGCNYCRPFMQEGQGHCPSQPAGSTRNEGDFAFEFVVHVFQTSSQWSASILV